IRCRACSSTVYIERIRYNSNPEPASITTSRTSIDYNIYGVGRVARPYTSNELATTQPRTCLKYNISIRIATYKHRHHIRCRACSTAVDIERTRYNSTQNLPELQHLEPALITTYTVSGV